MRPLGQRAEGLPTLCVCREVCAFGMEGGGGGDDGHAVTSQ